MVRFVISVIIENTNEHNHTILIIKNECILPDWWQLQQPGEPLQTILRFLETHTISPLTLYKQIN